jgi:hypothetical protein
MATSDKLFSNTHQIIGKIKFEVQHALNIL